MRTKHLTSFFVALLVALATRPAAAQVVPDRLYNGLHRPLPVSIEVPEGKAGEVEIRLFEPVVGSSAGPARPREVAKAVAVRGRADLASLFPGLWSEATFPGGPPRVLYAQLFVGGEAVGAATVLQPMLTPNRATLRDLSTLRVTEDQRVGDLVYDDERRTQEASLARSSLGSTVAVSPAFRRVYSGIRAYPDRRVVFETSEGVLEVRPRPDAAPNTAWWFLHLAENGFYDGTTFHRIVARLADGSPFGTQFGDPQGGGFDSLAGLSPAETGAGGSGQWQDLERSTLPHGYGVLSAARFGDADSWGGQVFIGLSRRGTAALDREFAAFAEVVLGEATLAGIAAEPTDPQDRPLNPPRIERVRVEPAPPVTDWPNAIREEAQPAAPVARPPR